MLQGVNTTIVTQNFARGFEMNLGGESLPPPFQKKKTTICFLFSYFVCNCNFRCEHQLSNLQLRQQKDRSIIYKKASRTRFFFFLISRGHAFSFTVTVPSSKHRMSRFTSRNNTTSNISQRTAAYSFYVQETQLTLIQQPSHPEAHLTEIRTSRS